MLADFNAVALVVNGGVKTHLAVAVAVQIEETDVPRIGYFDGPRKRLEGADDAVAVEIGEGNIVGRLDLNGQGETAFTPFLFRLQAIELPVGSVPHLDFIVDMVLARNLVCSALRLGIGDEHARAGKCRRRPYIQERASAAVGHPETWVLAVPVTIWVGIGGMIAVIRILT